MKRLLALLVSFAALPLIACGALSPHAESTRVLSWVEEDHVRAFEEARTTGRPLFVDTWAPWCHSCLALKNEVLNDPRLARYADRFVWLSLDVERESAASFLERFPQPAYPTLWVLRPDGRPLLRWVGTLTADHLALLLEDALTALREGDAEGPAALMLKAEAAAAEGRFDEAVLFWNDALAMAPSDWSRRSRTANALLFVLMKANQLEAGLELALREVPLARDGAGRADLVIGGLDCAGSLDPKDPKRQAGLEALIPHADKMKDDGRLLADDRSGLYAALVGAWGALGNTSKKTETNAAWIDFLEATVAAAPTPEYRAVFDSHRMTAYLGAGRGDEAIAMLGRSAKDFPEDYNPLARRAFVLLELGRIEEARQDAERALTLAYGPRRARIHTTLSRIHEKRGDPETARAVLNRAIAELDALPPVQRSERARAELVRRLESLPK
jgi:tetratricopeptide (TPR) repeat protein